MIQLAILNFQRPGVTRITIPTRISLLLYQRRYGWSLAWNYLQYITNCMRLNIPVVSKVQKPLNSEPILVQQLQLKHYELATQLRKVLQVLHKSIIFFLKCVQYIRVQDCYGCIVTEFVKAEDAGIHVSNKLSSFCAKCWLLNAKL